MKEIMIKSANESICTFNTSTNLPVYMWVNKDKVNVHISLVVKYGSTGTTFICNNSKYTVPTGTAHFLEHLKFHLKDVEVPNLFYDLGCDSNAYTSLNETSFEVFANDNIYDATKLLLDFVYDNYFSKKSVENERGIILEESNSYKDDPDYEFFQQATLNFLVKSTNRDPVHGYEKDIKKISVDDVSLVHDFFYRPENMFMVVTGNLDPELMKKTICENEKERTFKDIGKVEVVRNTEPKTFVKNKFTITNKNCSSTQGTYIVKCLEKDFKGYKKNEILVSLRAMINSNFGCTSDFYENVIQNEMATRLSSGVTYDDGVYGITFNYTTENPDKLAKLIDEQLKNVKITKDDINRILKLYETSSIMKYDNIYHVSAFIISSIVDDGSINEDKYEILKKLTPKKVNDIFKYVDLNNKMIGVMKKG